MLKQGQHVFLTATPGASQRTKNRIRERGTHGFEVLREAQPITAPDNRGGNWIMVMSADGKWSGWLPIDEVQIEQEAKD